MLTAYKNGAEQEAEIVTRYESGAEVEAEAVYAYKDGAEEEVWGGNIVCEFYSSHKNSSNVAFTHEVKNDGRTLRYGIGNNDASTGTSTMKFRITKAGVFGPDLKVRYTLTHNATQGMTYLEFTKGSYMLPITQTFHNDLPCTNQTFEETVTGRPESDYIGLTIGAYGNYDITGTITDLYINDKPVTFIE